MAMFSPTRTLIFPDVPTVTPSLSIRRQYSMMRSRSFCMSMGVSVPAQRYRRDDRTWPCGEHALSDSDTSARAWTSAVRTYRSHPALAPWPKGDRTLVLHIRLTEVEFRPLVWLQECAQ